jgi:LuxR family maltose regulon positive regulatory protein
MLAETHLKMPIITTKLHAPPLRPTSVARPRLVEWMTAGLWQNGSLSGREHQRHGFARKLTLISAPAGFGKTTLVSEWTQNLIQESPRVSISWLSLDSGDNDPSRFLIYLITALQVLDEHIGGAVLRTLASPEAAVFAQGAQIEMLLTDVINQVTGLSDSLTDDGSFLVLVIDDYHVVTAQPVHAAVEFLLEHLPDNLHVVIATRSDPTFRMARLVGCGQVLELRQADLRFDATEATAFLQQVTGLELEATDITALNSRTEGWIAGLQMAAISMQGRGENHASEFVQAFTASNRYILDYLVEEVLGQRPAGTREFLLQTSVLDRLSGPLCSAVIEPSDSRSEHLDCQLILEQLEHANLFINPLDHERRWYRYHRLFADLLRKRLGQEHPDLVPTLHRRASEWCEHNGHISAAIEHALSAGDVERAADLTEASVERVFLAGEYVTLLTRVQALPIWAMRRRPRLSAYAGIACFMAGRPLTEFAPLIGVLDNDSVEELPAELLVLRSLLLTFGGDLQKSIELCRRALEHLPAEEEILRGFAVRNLGAIYRLNGDVGATISAFQEALRLGQKTHDPIGASAALNYIAEMHAVQGQLHASKVLYEKALDMAVNGKGRRLPVAVKVLVGLADLYRQWNDLEQGTKCAQEAIDLSRSWMETWAIGAHVHLGRIRHALGDSAGAREAMSQAERLAVEYDATDLDDLAVAAFQARLCVAQGNTDAAKVWAEERALDVKSIVREMRQGGSSRAPYALRESEGITLARMYISQHRAEDAMAVLQALESAAERLGRTGVLIEILVLQALASSLNGDTNRALEALERAVSLGAPERYVRVFADEGTQLVPLLRRLVARGTAPRYVGQLLHACSGSASSEEGSSTATKAAQALVEPLSEREMDVLRLLNTHLTSTHMADELFIAVSTVRSHIKNIYGKLDVHSREEAVHFAQELGLI